MDEEVWEKGGLKRAEEEEGGRVKRGPRAAAQQPVRVVVVEAWGVSELQRAADSWQVSKRTIMVPELGCVLPAVMQVPDNVLFGAQAGRRAPTD